MPILQIKGALEITNKKEHVCLINNSKEVDLQGDLFSSRTRQMTGKDIKCLSKY